MNSLDPTKLNLGPLTRCTGGYYYELLIQNCTTDTIVVIDHENNKIPITPVTLTPMASEAVIVLWRKTLDSTATPNNNPKAISGYQIRIPKHLLMGEGAIFLKAVNVVVCSEAGAINACHPSAGVDYETAAYEIKKQLADMADEIPTISLMANDPKSRFNKLYTVVGDMPVDIPVTNIFGEANLKIVFSYKGQSREFNIDLEKFLDSTENVLEIDDCPIGFITTNKAIAERSSGEYKKISQAEANRLLKTQKEKLEHEMEVAEDQHKAEMRIKDQELDAMKTRLKMMESEYDRVKSEYDSFTGNVSARMKIGENELRREKAISGASEEKWKTIAVYGGVAVAGLTLMLKLIQLGAKTGIV